MVGRGSRVLGLSTVLNKWHIAAVPIHSVGDCLQPAVRESHEVLAVCVSSSPALLVAEVTISRDIIHSILPHILCISLKQKKIQKVFSLIKVFFYKS
jgi:hypothetical protein